MSPDALDPTPALSAWSLDGAAVTAVEGGHINRTWRVERGAQRLALQWLNPIFDPALHHDIEALTGHLARRGLLTPRLLRTATGALWHVDEGGQVWRVTTWIDGHTVLAADTPERCEQAGLLVGRFHAALWDVEHSFHFSRLGVHDTARHLRLLQRALYDHVAHSYHDEVAAMAEDILELSAGLDLAQDLPLRLVHGDPKISNIVFDDDGHGLALIDLDTLARMPLAVELGDAFRSWCNPGGEDALAGFNLAHFAAGLEGYARGVGRRPGVDERMAIPIAIERIALELAARFAADELNESYFNWNRHKYLRAAAHNVVRARAQLALARSVHDQRAILEHLTRAAWG